MKLFTRNVLMAGAPAETMAFSVGMCEFVTNQIGREVGLWSTIFGAPIGAMTYSMRVDGLADLQAVTAGLMADDAYHAKLAEGLALTGAPGVDGLAQPVHGELGDPPPVGSYASLTFATMANGKYIEAVGWGVEIAQLVEQVSGVPTMFLTSEYGGFGDVAWIAVTADAAAADAATAAISADADYVQKVNDAGDLFIPGSGQRSLITRIA